MPHFNHQRGEGHNRRKAMDYPYSDTSFNQECQLLATSERRRDDRVTVREGLREHEEARLLDPDVSVLDLHRELTGSWG